MDRLNLLNYQNKNNNFIIKNGDHGFYFLDCRDLKNIDIELENDANANVLLMNLNKNTDLKIKQNKGSYLNLKTILKDELEDFILAVDLENNAEIHAYFADFTQGNNHASILINLNKDNSKAYWHLASLSAKKDDKSFDVSLLHKGEETFGISDNYGVSKDDAKLVFSGVSTIINGAKFSKTRQNAKIMVFDESSKGIAKPILKIEENEIEASHGASVGKISDDTMFYLMSRGLNEDEAKQLITLGYLKPILLGFEEAELKDEISSLIEEKM